AGVAGGQDTVEHVDPRPDGVHHIARRSHPYEVAWARVGHVGSELGYDAVHLFDRLAYREAAQRQPVEGERAELFDVTLAQAQVQPALHDAEQGLPVAARRERAMRPPRGPRDGGLDFAEGRSARWAHVELHGDVGAEPRLHAHRFLRRQVVLRAVEVRP